MLVALAALFVALGGPAQAAKLLDGKDIRKGTVASKQVKDRSLRTRDLSGAAKRALTATPDGSITEPKLADNAVSTRALAPGSVLTGSVADNALTANDLAPNAAGAEEVADNAVGQPEIRNNGVGPSELADNSIDGGKVLDGTLSLRDVARQTGTFQWPIETLAAGACEVEAVVVTGIEIAGDHVLASPTSPWPAELVYTVGGTAAPRTFKAQACNRGRDPLPGATYQFNYAILGA